MRSARRGAIALRATELAGVLLVAVVDPVLFGLDPRSTDAPTAKDLLLAMPLHAGLALLVGALLMRGPGRPLRPREEWTSWREQLALGLPLMLGLWLVDTLFRNALRGLGAPGGSTPWTAAFSDPEVIAVFPLTTLVAVAYEEVIFRAYLLTRLSAWMGSLPALVVSALCFAASHSTYTLPDQAAVFVSGLLFGVGWLGTRSLIALVGAHWAYDVLVLVSATQ